MLHTGIGIEWTEMREYLRHRTAEIPHTRLRRAISEKLPEITSILDMAVGMFVKKRTKQNINY